MIEMYTIELLQRQKTVMTMILCLLFKIVCAQQLPEVIQPSPETATLFRYQEYPMDYSTGLAQISIPLFEVKSGDLSVPISISYHASGCQVSDRDGPIAVGWSLNAGGMISRTVHGSPDFGGGVNKYYPFPHPFITNGINPNYNQDDLAYIEKIMHFDKNPDLAPQVDWLDAEYDIFSYSFGGNTGKFLFKDENGIKTPVLLPHKSYKITPITFNSSLSSINILDENGIFYSFQGSEYISPFSSGYGIAKTGYAIKEIISANKTDIITFEYKTFNQERYSIDQNIILEDNFVSLGTGVGIQINQIPSQSYNHDLYSISRLTEIDFNQGKVLIHLVNDSDLINNIEVIDKEGNVIRTIQFFRSILHSLAEVQYGTHKLDKIVIKNRSGANVEEYSFEYYPTSYVGGSNQINVRHKDWWGYYNASGEHDMVPYHINLTVQNSVGIHHDYNLGNINADREPDLDAMKSGVLKKITYPTGGSTEFIYENNKYFSLSTQQIKDGPGLRVAQMMTNDNNGNIHTKTFKYGIEESGYGFIDIEPLLNFMHTKYRYDYFRTSFSGARSHNRHRVFYSGFAPQLKEVVQRPIIYTEVTAYNGTPGNNIGKTIYNYTRIPWGAAGLGPQKWHIYDYNYWNNASLIKKTDFKYVEGTTYQKRKEITNRYSTNTFEYIKGLHAQRLHVLPQTNRVLDSNLYPESHAVQEENLPIYHYSEYRIPVGIKNLTSTTETLYNDDGSEVSNSTSYTYNTHQLISQITHSASDGKVLNTQMKYPFDDTTSDPVLTQMIDPNINMLNFPIEQSEFKNGLPVKSVQTNYGNWGSTDPMIAPQAMKISKGSSSYEPRLQFHEYDSQGNLLDVSKEGGSHIVYIWGYNDEYPIAKIENATYSDVSAYEADLKMKSNADNDNCRSATCKEQVLRNSLQNLRDALPDAMITSYTYDPLIGVTSITDPKGYTTYYEYDDFNRLMAIRDTNDNLISVNKYRYGSETN